MTAAGVLLERCFTTRYTGKGDWNVWFDDIRDCGPQVPVLSSDLSQPFNPPVEDGLVLCADRLLQAGFNDEEIRTMAVPNSTCLVGAPALPDAPAREEKVGVRA
jgi:hypothetical protein